LSALHTAARGDGIEMVDVITRANTHYDNRMRDESIIDLINRLQAAARGEI